jgi:NAD(P)-dependent dehydrogenase (short-subunit alcohol dehydrogenase family)
VRRVLPCPSPQSVGTDYGGNDEAAQAFKAETGIPVFKFDVGDAAACEQGSADHRLPLLEGHLVEHAVAGDAGIVDQDVDRAEHGMRARGFGRIILISSINGQKGQMGQTNYSAAKALVQVNIESRLVRITACHCSKVILWNMPSRVMPASSAASS